VASRYPLALLLLLSYNNSEPISRQAPVRPMDLQLCWHWVFWPNSLIDYRPILLYDCYTWNKRSVYRPGLCVKRNIFLIRYLNDAVCSI
jgi:hypothetical protein